MKKSSPTPTSETTPMEHKTEQDPGGEELNVDMEPQTTPADTAPNTTSGVAPKQPKKKRKKNSGHQQRLTEATGSNALADLNMDNEDVVESKSPEITEQDTGVAVITTATTMTTTTQPIAKGKVCQVSFPDISPLVSMISVLESLLEEAPMSFIAPGYECEMSRATQQKLVSEDVPSTPFSGLYFKCIDASHTCLVIGKLSANVQIAKGTPIEDANITVPMNVLSSHLKSIDGGSTVQLFTTDNDPSLMIRSSSSMQSMHFRTTSINTTSTAQHDFDISGISYDFTVEFDLRTFQNILRIAKLIKSEFIRIRVLVMPQSTDVENNPTRTFLVINTYGLTSSDEHVFCSNTVDTSDDHVIVVKNAEDTIDIKDPNNDPANILGSSLVSKYSGIFASDHLSSFLRNLEQPIVTLRISANMCHPMILTSALGDGHSFISFVLAAKEDMEAFPDTLVSFKM